MNLHPKIAIAGSGFSGAVIAQQLAAAGYSVDVYESRNHIAGNCFSQRDSETGIMVHQYGPHIFHTDNEKVWGYLQQYAQFMPYTNRVKARVHNSIYSLPVNLLTLNQFFGKTWSPKEAQEFLGNAGDSRIEEPQNFEEQALKFMGQELYNAFFRGYTLKQWGRDPKTLPASILKRLPMRFNYDDNYFNHKFQGMPKEGYTDIIAKMLDHPAIRVLLNTPYQKTQNSEYWHVFYSGPIDHYFDHCHGRLAYRTLTFERGQDEGDYQGCAVLNYCDAEVPFTRISEHKHFAPWEQHSKTLYFKEFSREAEAGDDPFYPIGLTAENQVLQQYQALAAQESNVTFVGRLGTYRYLDMDVTIAEALATAEAFLERPTEPQANA